jgi:hypothetical protein
MVMIDNFSNIKVGKLNLVDLAGSERARVKTIKNSKIILKNIKFLKFFLNFRFEFFKLFYIKFLVNWSSWIKT